MSLSLWSRQINAVVMLWDASHGLISLFGRLLCTHPADMGVVAIVSDANFTIEGEGFAYFRSWVQFRRVIGST